MLLSFRRLVPYSHQSLRVFLVKNDFKLVSLEKLPKLMFFHFKFSQLKIEVSENFNPMENSVIQFSVIDC